MLHYVIVMVYVLSFPSWIWHPPKGNGLTRRETHYVDSGCILYCIYIALDLLHIGEFIHWTALNKHQEFVWFSPSSFKLSPFLCPWESPDGMSLIFSWPSVSQYNNWAFYSQLKVDRLELQYSAEDDVLLSWMRSKRLYHIHHDLLLLRNDVWKEIESVFTAIPQGYDAILQWSE